MLGRAGRPAGSPRAAPGRGPAIATETPTAQFTSETSSRGAWVRQANRFTDRITADGSSGYPAETGRYHLYVCYACPWAHRSIIVRRLLGLEDVLGMTAVDPIRDERGWRFTLEPDPVNGF